MRFLSFMRRRFTGAWGLITAACLAGMVSGGTSVALLALINRTLEESPVEEGLLRLGLAFVGLCVLVTAARIGARYLLARYGQHMIMGLRLSLCRQILATPLAQLETLGPYRLLVTLTEDVNALLQALLVIPVVCINGTIVVGCLAYLAWLNQNLFLLLVVVLLLGALSYQLPAQLGLRRLREAREQEDVLYDHFRSLTQGIKELQLHRPRQQAFDGLLWSTSDSMRRLRIAATMIYGSAAAWGHLLFFVVIGVLLYARPPFIEAGIGTLTGYTLVLLYMMTPLHTLLDTIPILGRADVAVDKVDLLGLSLAPSEEDPGRPGLPTSASDRGWRRLEADGVTYAYRREDEDREFVLGPVDLVLEPGEIVFLVGGNGSGKTTLAKLLVGLYSPTDGEVRIDGTVVDDSNRAEYRQRFSVVFGDFYLFESLLGIEMGNLDDVAREHLERLGLAHKVQVDGGRISTLDLSQGQRKRLALLTAYLEDRPIYLFDEWAADQDPLFKEIFYRQILPELKARGKGVIVISHDDRYFDAADRVLKLEEGQLLGIGPPSADLGPEPLGAPLAPGHPVR